MNRIIGIFHKCDFVYFAHRGRIDCNFLVPRYRAADDFINHYVSDTRGRLTEIIRHLIYRAIHDIGRGRGRRNVAVFYRVGGYRRRFGKGYRRSIDRLLTVYGVDYRRVKSSGIERQYGAAFDRARRQRKNGSRDAGVDDMVKVIERKVAGVKDFYFLNADLLLNTPLALFLD